MLNKTKKVAFLTSGLAGALVVSSAVGVALSSCTTTTSSSDTSNKYTYSIDWTDQDQLKQLTIDEQGLVYSSANKTEIIAVAPNTAATSFVIPASVKYITGYNEITKNSDGTVATSTTKGAFQGLVSLISVTFASNNTLVSIGDSSFYGCTYLSTINLPSSTSVVYNNAFYGCANLRSINLVGVSYIGSAAFQGAMANGAGVSLDLSSASYIGDNAFNNSTSLVSVDFSKNTTLTYIGRSAFAGAFVSGDSAATLDLSKTTSLKTISDSAFAGCTNLGSIVLPSTSVLTTIGANAFNGATSLTQVGATAGTFTAPSSLGNYATTTVGSTNYVSSGIGANAFNGTKIATVDLSAVTATTPFTNAVFKNMTSLAKVNFGSAKITTIPYSLFEGDTALTSLTLPSSITTIQDGTNNTKTDSTYVDQRSPFYNSGLQTIDMSAITSYSTGTATWYNVTIDKTTMLPYSLFRGLTSLTTVILKSGTTVINSDAFYGASALTTVKEGGTSTLADNASGLVISPTLQMINSNAFEGTGIKSVSFASTDSSTTNSLWFVGKGAFANTTALTSVDLAAADTTQSHKIYNTAIIESSTQTEWTFNGLANISINTFSGATALKSVKLPSSIANIYSNAFVGNTALTSVNFSDLTNLISIGNTNFTGASALNDIDLSANSKFTGITTATNIFTGLPTTATVKLPSIATTLAASSFITGADATATIANRPAIKYDATTSLNLSLDKSSVTILGTSTNIGALGSSSSSTVTYPNTMLQYISGDYDLTKSANTATATSSVITSGAQIGYYYAHSFFGNTKLTGLTMSASNFALGGTSVSNATQATYLFYNNVSSAGQSADYVYNKVPFGGNTSLKNFTFVDFDINSSPSYPTGSGSEKIDANPLYKTTNKTWAQVATIINKFASNSTSAITTWPTISATGTAADSTSKVQFDSAITTQSNASTGYTISFSDAYENTNTALTGSSKTVSQTFTNSLENEDTKSWSFIHNGVTWTLTITPKTTSAEGSVTLVGQDINVYKATNSTASIKNQIPFAVTTNSDGSKTASKITVTLKIV